MGKIVIAGGSGFLGQELSAFLKAAGHEVVVLSRSSKGKEGWDGRTLGPWTELLEGALAVVNLSGQSVVKKWNAANRQVILSSRVDSTRAIGAAIQASKNPPKVWVNASATGYYGDTGEDTKDESSPPGKGFLAEVCLAWEAAVEQAATPNTRKAVLRISVVLGHGGPLKVLSKLTRFGLGGSAGSGRQWMSWIHVRDLCKLVLWSIENEKAPAVMNACSPEPVRNGELMAVLRKILHRPWSPPAPAFAMKIVGAVVGMEVTPILESCRALPTAAQAAGFELEFPEIEKALKDLLD